MCQWCIWIYYLYWAVNVLLLVNNWCTLTKTWKMEKKVKPDVEIIAMTWGKPQPPSDCCMKNRAMMGLNTKTWYWTGRQQFGDSTWANARLILEHLVLALRFNPKTRLGSEPVRRYSNILPLCIFKGYVSCGHLLENTWTNTTKI